MLIAEIGLNHLGNTTLAKKYIKSLVNTEIDGITLQVRESDYYINNPKFKLTKNLYQELINLAKQYDKQIGIAIADINMIDFFESLNIDFYKVIRNDIINKKLITKLISTNKKLIISTGLSSENDIQNFINEFGTKNITLNHTQLSYDPKDCNLSAIKVMKSQYNCNISYGSHCDNKNVLYMALCYNPSDILFYVKYDDQIYPDDKHAIKLNNIDIVITNLKNLTAAVGTGIKNKMKIKIK